jgi:biotin-(acetyl-CoA carboxylase) ligase
MSGVPVVGIMSGITNTGALLLDTAEGQKVFHGGEISLRKV